MAFVKKMLSANPFLRAILKKSYSSSEDVHSTSIENNDRVEESLHKSCSKDVPSTSAENNEQLNKNLRRKSFGKRKIFEIENGLKHHCETWQIPYLQRIFNETTSESTKRRKIMRTKIKNLKLQSYRNSDEFTICKMMGKLIDKVDALIIEEENIVFDVVTQLCNTVDESISEEMMKALHSNPNVYKATEIFENGETLHTVDTCNVCLETRPVFHNTKSHTHDGNVNHISLSPWKIMRDGSCERCHKEKLCNLKKQEIMQQNFQDISAKKKTLDMPPIQ